MDDRPRVGILNAEAAAVRRALELGQDTIPPSDARRGSRSRRVGRRFTLRWRGRDPAAREVGGGVASYAVYVRRGGSYKLWRPPTPTVRYRGRRGKRYSFHVRARDRAENIEAAPSRPTPRCGSGASTRPVFVRG